MLNISPHLHKIRELLSFGDFKNARSLLIEKLLEKGAAKQFDADWDSLIEIFLEQLDGPHGSSEQIILLSQLTHLLEIGEHSKATDIAQAHHDMPLSPKQIINIHDAYEAQGKLAQAESYLSERIFHFSGKEHILWLAGLSSFAMTRYPGEFFSIASQFHYSLVCRDEDTLLKIFSHWLDSTTLPSSSQRRRLNVVNESDTLKSLLSKAAENMPAVYFCQKALQFIQSSPVSHSRKVEKETLHLFMEVILILPNCRSLIWKLLTLAQAQLDIELMSSLRDLSFNHRNFAWLVSEVMASKQDSLKTTFTKGSVPKKTGERPEHRESPQFDFSQLTKPDLESIRGLLYRLPVDETKEFRDYQQRFFSMMVQSRDSFIEEMGADNFFVFCVFHDFDAPLFAFCSLVIEENLQLEGPLLSILLEGLLYFKSYHRLIALLESQKTSLKETAPELSIGAIYLRARALEGLNQMSEAMKLYGHLQSLTGGYRDCSERMDKIENA